MSKNEFKIKILNWLPHNPKRSDKIETYPVRHQINGVNMWYSINIPVPTGIFFRTGFFSDEICITSEKKTTYVQHFLKLRKSYFQPLMGWFIPGVSQVQQFLICGAP